MTYTRPEERREYQRLNLYEPIEGTFEHDKVRILDVSENGALFETFSPMGIGSMGTLRFGWREKSIAVDAEVVRGDEHRVGIRFLHGDAALMTFIAEAAEERLRAQRANALGIRNENGIDGDRTITNTSQSLISGLVSWTLKDGKWRKRAALIPDQPPNGFTISAGETDDQVELLCTTYENGDDDTRDLIRTMAEMSVQNSLALGS